MTDYSNRVALSTCPKNLQRYLASCQSYFKEWLGDTIKWHPTSSKKTISCLSLHFFRALAASHVHSQGFYIW